jgi:hypothetical protein
MSSKNNVNPGTYKVKGRERQGEDVVHEDEKQTLAQERARLPREEKDEPGAAPARPGGEKKK